MPPAIIAALIGAGTAGTEMGLQASGALSPGTGGGQAAAAAATQSQETALKNQEQQAFKQFAPDVQSSTGGALSNPAFAQMVAELAGSPQDIGLAQQTVFGNVSPTFGTSSGPGLASTVG